jgi:hypothetical protein
MSREVVTRRSNASAPDVRVDGVPSNHAAMIDELKTASASSDSDLTSCILHDDDDDR